MILYKIGGEMPLELTKLNTAQRQAVEANSANTLVLAGAGSGKTRVLTYRIAWLIEQAQSFAGNILAVTFTNKAAREMSTRLHELLGDQARSIWVGTFHGLAHKMLRINYKQANLVQNFQIIDSDDQLRLIKKIIKELKIDNEELEPKYVQSFINRKKDEAITASRLPAARNLLEMLATQIYQRYESDCETLGLVDFAGILLKSYSLLINNPDILESYQFKFWHILVDEFQDTNTIQYSWLHLLGQNARTTFVVGDDDQSIYGWRGAKIENIDRYVAEYNKVKVVRLEQNYRSTSVILEAANALIGKNSARMGKTLWTDGDAGDKIELYGALNEEDESLYVVRHIKKYLESSKSLNDVAILYRSNSQSRMLEETLARFGIPYKVYGGLRFFERAEIKDALAYLRLAANMQDNAAFERIINVPARGIGAKTVLNIIEYANLHNCAYLEAAKFMLTDKMFSAKAQQGINSFIQLIGELAQEINARDCSIPEVIKSMVQKSCLYDYYKGQTSERAQARAENLQELINATSDFIFETDEDFPINPIVEFLSYTALAANDAADDNDFVQLMTIHAAKGLEFKQVFMVGLEETLFPHQMSSDSLDKLEEERRLCYVGLTRAKENLFLTFTNKRRVFGSERTRRASRFLREIPQHLLIEKGRSFAVTANSSYGRAISSPHSNISVPKSTSISDSGFSLGQRVRHKKFGEGIIIDAEGEGERVRVNVKFAHAGLKWLVLSYAKLEEF